LVIKLDGKNDGRDHLALFRIFALILCLIICFTNEIDFLLDFLGQSTVLDRSIFLWITSPSGVLNKGFATTKTTLVLYQKLSVGLRKRFKGCRRSGGG